MYDNNLSRGSDANVGAENTVMLKYVIFRDELQYNSTCNSSMIEDPSNEVLIIQEEELTPDASEDFVQISPQRIKMRLRVGREEKIQFRVAQVHF